MACLPRQSACYVLRVDRWEIYQPIVDKRTGETVSAEALMRWTLRDSENISPALFIPIAGANDFIGKLTRLALQRVSEDFGAFRTRPTFKISVNAVPADMVDSKFHRALQGHIEERGIASKQLAFELTERTSAKLESAASVMHELGARGYEICIDDFSIRVSRPHRKNGQHASRVRER